MLLQRSNMLFVTAELFITAACIVGCSQPDNSTAKPGRQKSSDAPVTLRGLVYEDMHSPHYLTQRPLLTINYFPGGAEMIFKRPAAEEEIHAVFPKGIPAPQKDELSGTFTLNGEFETIKTQPDNTTPPRPVRMEKGYLIGYRYFKVSSWERTK